MTRIDHHKKSFRKFQETTIARMTGSVHVERGGPLYWRARILFALTLTGLIFGFLAFVPLVFVVLKEGLWGLAIFDIASWLVGIIILFFPKMRYEIRAGIALITIYLVGLFIIFNVGPLSGGPMLIFAFAVLVGVLLGSKPAIMALILNTVTITIFGWLITSGVYTYTFPFFKNIEMMLIAGATFILSNAMATMSVSVLVKGLVTTSQKERSLTHTLEKERAQLLMAKENLELEVEERRSAEKAMKESEGKYRDLFQNLPIGVGITDLEGNLIDCNDAVVQPGGYDRADLDVIKNVSELYYDEQERERVFDALGSSDLIDEFEVRLKRKDGTAYHALLSLRPITIKGKPCWHAVVNDITDRRKAESALRKSEKRQSELIQKAFDIIYETDAHGFVKSASPATEAVFGFTPDNIIGKHFVEFIHESDREKAAALFKKGLQGKELGTIQLRGRRFDGAPISLDLKYILETEDGEVAGTFGVIRDVTEKRRLEDQLQRAQKLEAIGTLAGGIAHDFNNLLMGIQGRNSMVMAGMAPSHRHYENLAGIEEHVKSASNLTKQLLGFARGGKYEVKPLDLNRLLEKSSDMFGRTRKEISIHRKLNPDLWTVDADLGQIEQVLLNIYVNAWHSMPDGGDLYIETGNQTFDRPAPELFHLPPGRYVKISISDTGVGMDKSIQDKIFDPFFTTKKMGRGTGLGLASAYGIIQNHNGTIAVDSVTGRGATFTILLPASDKEIAEAMQTSDPILKGQETILLVDDEDIIIDVGQQMLETMGYQTFTAGGGKEAVQVYTDNMDSIDMVILDMIMPDMNGSDTFKKLKKIDPAVKVLLSSGYSIDGQATEILNMGCKGFIQKPFNLKELSAKLRTILE